MKWLPTLLVLGAFLILLKVSALRPEEKPESATGAAAAGSKVELPQAENVQTPVTREDSKSTTPANSVVSAPAPVVRQEPPAPPEPSAGEIAGTVLTPADSGAPKMRVALLKDNQVVQSVPTNEYGHFRLKGIDPGTYVLKAEDPQLLYTMSTREIVRLINGAGAKVSIRLSRGDASVAGRLKSTADSPIRERKIRLTSAEHQIEVTTDERGEFILGGLPAGTWKIEPEGHPEAATTVKLTSGGLEQVNLPAIRITSSLTFHFHDSKLKPYHFQGREIAHLRLVVEPPLPAIAAPINEHGEVRYADLGPGKYEMSASRAEGGHEVPLVKSLYISVGEGEDRSWNIALNDSLRGQGIHVPIGTKVMMVIAFVIAFALPLMLFPAPLVPKRPPTLS